jgi:hypothetical protein
VKANLSGVNGEVHGGRPGPTGALVPRKRNYLEDSVNSFSKGGGGRDIYSIGLPLNFGRSACTNKML